MPLWRQCRDMRTTGKTEIKSIHLGFLCSFGILFWVCCFVGFFCFSVVGFFWGEGRLGSFCLVSIFHPFASLLSCVLSMETIRKLSLEITSMAKGLWPLMGLQWQRLHGLRKWTLLQTEHRGWESKAERLFVPSVTHSKFNLHSPSCQNRKAETVSSAEGLPEYAHLWLPWLNRQKTRHKKFTPEVSISGFPPFSLRWSRVFYKRRVCFNPSSQNSRAEKYLNCPCCWCEFQGTEQTAPVAAIGIYSCSAPLKIILLVTGTKCSSQTAQ